MDTGYLAQQVTTIIGKLHSLFDEIGVPSHERDSRESDLFSSLSETLHNHLRLVASEKNDLVEEAQRVITTIQQMEASLEDVKDGPSRNNDLKITFPLTECLKMLKEKHRTVQTLHQERYEQIRKLVEALESYSSHLEPAFLRIKLPPMSAEGTIPPTFDLSPAYINSVDDEFTRVYEEYNRRVELVQQTAQEIINLWAELGTPQAQTEATIIKCYREAPEQLGLHENDIDRIQQRRDKLLEEKRGREKRINQIKAEVVSLWDRLGVDEQDRKAFLARNRGCGLRNINDLEDELSRLHELKRQNLGLFVEDARARLQTLWDELYFSEDEAVEFTPMFCDVYSDALLSAHETEIARLEVLKEQRKPTLQLIDKHRSLLKDREDLASSSQDASRLLLKPAKGEKRDPTRLLREEKMRKRIAKDLPKVEAEVMKTLEAWEEEYGRPFLVFGERYLDVVAEAATKGKPPPRSKTPNPGQMGPPPKPSSKTPNTAASSSSSSRQVSTREPPASTFRTTTKATSATGGTMSRAQHPPPSSTKSQHGTLKSPSKIPSRVPLGTHVGNTSPSRQQHQQRPPTSMSQNENGNSTLRIKPMGMAPPPKMRNLYQPQQAAAGLETPRTGGQGYAASDVSRSGSVVRGVMPEDPYNDYYLQQQQQQQREQQQHFAHSQASHVSHLSNRPVYAPGRSVATPFLPKAHNDGQYSHADTQMLPPARPLPLPQGSHSQHTTHAQNQNQNQNQTQNSFGYSTTSQASTAPSTINYNSSGAPSRQISAESSSSAGGGGDGGSENWEAYGSDDETSAYSAAHAQKFGSLAGQVHHHQQARQLYGLKRGMEVERVDEGRGGKFVRAMDGRALREGSGSWTGSLD